MKKTNIKIFVSHRIDQESETIKNPLYVNVRCGAVYDKRSDKQINGMLGDDTGDNISAKRELLGEYTVQYWAWKNVDADYYGLCHYRRYLSFCDEFKETSQSQGFIVSPKLNTNAAKSFFLLDKKKIENIITTNDLVVSPLYDVKNTPIFPIAKRNYDLWVNNPNILIFPEHIELLKSLVRDRFPQYYQSLIDTLESGTHRGFNCYVMKREYFFLMCEFEYAILFELEKVIPLDSFEGATKRTLGYLGEILYGAFISWMQKQPSIKYVEKQIVLFSDTSRNDKVFNGIFYDGLKSIAHTLFPAYRIGKRIENNTLSEASQLNNLVLTMRQLSNELLNIKQNTDALINLNKYQFWTTNPVYPENMQKTQINFWNSIPKAEGEVSIIQQANLMLLKELKRICDGANIKFWLHGGSLVGSLRHNGYVPWDDDVDVAMMRSDYERLKEELNKTTYEIVEYYYSGLGARAYRFKHRYAEGNFFVDIFLYDKHILETDSIADEWNMMKSFKTRLIGQFIKLQSQQKIFGDNICLNDTPEFKSKIDNLIDTYIKRFYSTSGNYICWGIENNFEIPSKFAWHNGRIFKKEDIFPLRRGTFEGDLYWIPCDSVKYCFSEYGIDYLEMPNSIGVSVHKGEYFRSCDIAGQYDELKKLIDGDK